MERHVTGAVEGRAPRSRFLSAARPSVLILVLLGLLAREVAIPPPAAAEGKEDELLSIAKMTVYGALLGGLLGLASALVVKDDYKDDAIRWGITGGAFSGFIYGIMSHREDDEFGTNSRFTPPGRAEEPQASPLAASLLAAIDSRSFEAAGRDLRGDRIGDSFDLDRIARPDPGTSIPRESAGVSASQPD